MRNLKETNVKVKKLNERARLPCYETQGAAGMDISACIEAPLTLGAGEWAMVKTGLALEIPDGFEAQIRPRSGLAAKRGLTVLNAPGTIDSDYRGELSIIIINHSKNSETINDGERIAQIVFAPVTRVCLTEAAALGGTARGEGGFGSTGV
jgi:dUTP pyrophosphatase